MFELLLLIYLLPVIFVAALLFKAGFVAGKENLSACRMADKASVCACLEVLVAHIGCDCRSTVHQPSSGFKIADGKKVVPDEEVGYDFMLSMF